MAVRRPGSLSEYWRDMVEISRGCHGFREHIVVDVSFIPKIRAICGKRVNSYGNSRKTHS